MWGSEGFNRLNALQKNKTIWFSNQAADASEFIRSLAPRLTRTINNPIYLYTFECYSLAPHRVCRVHVGYSLMEALCKKAVFNLFHEKKRFLNNEYPCLNVRRRYILFSIFSPNHRLNLCFQKNGYSNLFPGYW